MREVESAMKRYQCVFRSPRASVILDVDATDGANAFVLALRRNRVHFLGAEVWDETGLVRILTLVAPPTPPMND